MTPFPWSAELLSAAGVDARFVGHPLIDIVKPSVPREEFLREMGLDPSVPTIGLFPGSRAHEIGEHLPVLGRVRPDNARRTWQRAVRDRGRVGRRESCVIGSSMRDEE